MRSPFRCAGALPVVWAIDFVGGSWQPLAGECNSGGYE
jgi:hypothetical protein